MCFPFKSLHFISLTIFSEGELGNVAGDDYGYVRSRKTFNHVTLVGTHSIIGRSLAVSGINHINRIQQTEPLSVTFKMNHISIMFDPNGVF